ALALSVVVLAGSALAAPAEALTTRDIIELTRAGLGEDVLLALIEVDGSVFAIDPAALKALKAAGVSEKVIVALVRSGREPAAIEPPMPVVDPPPAPVDPAPQPQVVVIDHHEPPREVVVPVPVYVAVSPHSRHRADVHRQPAESNFVPFQFGLPPVRPVAQQPKKPVYWGFGGKLRPDAWKPERHEESRRDSRKDSHK
ncbi:MAG: hypothetical protein ACRD1U_17375, partial [Vicinamibacterales bacterium]